MEGSSSSSSNNDAGEAKSGCCTAAVDNNNDVVTAAAAAAAAKVARRAAAVVAAKRAAKSRTLDMENKQYLDLQAEIERRKTWGTTGENFQPGPSGTGEDSGNFDKDPEGRIFAAAVQAVMANRAVRESEITITVSPTTGGQFDLDVLKTDSVESLKKLISKRLRVPKERICLLYRER